jgi:hypothetical protein
VRSALIVATMVLVAACGDTQPGAGPTDGTGMTETSPSSMEPTTNPLDVRPSFPDEPTVMTDFRQGPGDWDLPSSTSAQGLRLAPDGATSLVPAPVTVEPRGRATFIEVVLDLVAGDGTSGAYCRGDAQSRYESAWVTISEDDLNPIKAWHCERGQRETYGPVEPAALTLSTEGRLALIRVDADGSRELSGDVGREYPRPGPALLRLICVEEGDELIFVVSLDALGTFVVTDPDPLPAPADGGTGVVATGDVEVDVVGAVVWLAE